MEEKFTVAEFKNYVTSRDSLGDVLYFLNADNIRKANTSKENAEETLSSVKFPDTEEMHCPECNRPTPHSLFKDRASAYPSVADDLWTCTIPGCGHQLS